MTTPDVTLLPCPKCEGLDLNPNWTEVESTQYHHVQCDGCGHIVGDMGEYTTASSARDAWNTRPTPAAAPDVVERVARAMAESDNCYYFAQTDNPRDEHWRLARAAIAAMPEAGEVARLREANRCLRDGYADAVSGYQYILQNHSRLSGVGFDRVMDHYAQWVTIPEREGLLAGSHKLASEPKP